MNEITRMYIQKQKASGMTAKDFIKTITNEEHKMYIQWKIFHAKTK